MVVERQPQVTKLRTGVGSPGRLRKRRRYTQEYCAAQTQNRDQLTGQKYFPPQIQPRGSSHYNEEMLGTLGLNLMGATHLFDLTMFKYFLPRKVHTKINHNILPTF